ncbi:MAG: alcohol dehydrogenase catalytic domain-containing protein [Solirubrobacterales bacterium]
MAAIGPWLRSGFNIARPAGRPAAKIAIERDLDVRRRRLSDAARDRINERRRPTRPKMRSLVASPGGRMRWRSLPTPPPPGPDAAVVHPIAIATCDMDRPIGLGHTPFPMPLCFGHECVAEVLTVGERVETVKPGDRVVVPFQISCGECVMCRGGHTSNCLSVPPISMYGFGLAGGHWGGAVADELAVPFADGMLVPLPDGIDPAAAASVADNVSDAHRHIAPYLPGLIEEGRDPEVIVFGAVSRRTVFTASVPQYTALIAKALGASRVTVVDARPAIRRQIEALGLDAADPSELGGTTAPLVTDVSGHRRGTRLAVQKTAPDGFCSSAGGLHANVKVPLSAMFGRNVSLRVSRSDARAEIPAVLELMSSGKLRPELVTTQLAPIDDAVSALESHMRGGETKTILVE